MNLQKRLSVKMKQQSYKCDNKITTNASKDGQKNLKEEKNLY